MTIILSYLLLTFLGIFLVDLTYNIIRGLK